MSLIAPYVHSHEYDVEGLIKSIDGNIERLPSNLKRTANGSSWAGNCLAFSKPQAQEAKQDRGSNGRSTTLGDHYIACLSEQLGQVYKAHNIHYVP